MYLLDSDTVIYLDDFELAIAATALSYNLILVTNNTDHFSRIDGLRLENWTVSHQ